MWLNQYKVISEAPIQATIDSASRTKPRAKANTAESAITPRTARSKLFTRQLRSGVVAIAGRVATAPEPSARLARSDGRHIPSRAPSRQPLRASYLGGLASRLRRNRAWRLL